MKECVVYYRQAKERYEIQKMKQGTASQSERVQVVPRKPKVRGGERMTIG